MNELDPKSAADYERELKERQRLLGSASGQKIPSELPYISYQTDEPGRYILEYVGGRRILVEIDQATGKEYFLRELWSTILKSTDLTNKVSQKWDASYNGILYYLPANLAAWL